MREILIVIDVLAAVGIIALVLLQQGKGADLGAAFGGGASSSLFGARGAANFLSRATAILATVFFVVNLTLAWMAAREVGPKSVTETVSEQPARIESGAVPPPVPDQRPAEGRGSLPPEVPK
jgi:preprotein translocase subunit SecG